MASSLHEFLTSTFFIEASHAAIRETAARVVAGEPSPAGKANRLFYFVRDDVGYNVFTPKYRRLDFRAGTTLERGKGLCIQKAVLLAALCRSAGLPARLRFITVRSLRDTGSLQRVIQSALLVYHGYNEILLNGRWVAADASLSRSVCERTGIIPIEFDGLHDADYRVHNEKGPVYELITDHGSYPDLPYREIMEAWDLAWGKGPASLFKHMPPNPGH